MEEHQLVVEYRRDGDIVKTEHVFDTEQGDRILSALYTSMSAVADSLFKPKEAQDANIAKDFLPQSLYSARIATSPLPNGPLMVIRLQYRGEITKAGAKLGDLKVEPEQVKILEDLLKLPDGLILMVGPTGSGKTTTLQKILASLHTITEGKKRIITVEDPVEIPIPGAMQTAVRRTMRLDPDIVMVGEMRDEATAQSTIRAALTGHLAFSTLHAKSTSHTLARLADLGVRELDLKDPEMIRGIMFQALLKRLCDDCKVPVVSQPGEAIWPEGAIWSRTMGDHLKGDALFCRNPKGCLRCDRTGYRGRTPVLEVISTDEEYLELSFERRRKEAIDHIRSKGMITIQEHALLRIRRGEVDPRDAEDQLGELLPKLPMLSQKDLRPVETPAEATHLRPIAFPRKLETTEITA
jgi:type II secretory ATPase GspE/PulE/Tfp pilus assembly ATPase PilB-like protein